MIPPCRADGTKDRRSAYGTFSRKDGGMASKVGNNRTAPSVQNLPGSAASALWRADCVCCEREAGKTAALALEPIRKPTFEWTPRLTCWAAELPECSPVSGFPERSIFPILSGFE